MGLKAKVMKIDSEIKTQLDKELGPFSFGIYMRVARNSLGLTQEAFKRVRWAERGLKFELKPHQARFGIIQGGLYKRGKLEE